MSERTSRCWIFALCLAAASAFAGEAAQKAEEANTPETAHPEGPARTAAPVHPFESAAELTPGSRIDELVFDRLEALGIQPARLCSDAVFLRRAHLDVIGTLPTIQEAREFLESRDESKRRALIDRLLERSEFADYWAMRWSDVLRIKSEFPINLWPNGVQAYYRWIHTSIRENLPYDRFARELLTSSGSNFRVGPVNFYRALQGDDPRAIAEAVALTFLGVRAASWPEDRWRGMAAFFSHVGFKDSVEWKEVIVFHDSVKAAADIASGAPAEAVFPDGAAVQLSPQKDPRDAFADWLMAPGNPWFARNIANRTWHWLQGRGIIHEPDDIRPDNPPSHPELLAYLEEELVESGYDLKRIFRLILDSRVYQLSSIPRTDHPEGEAYLAFYPLRQLDAEVLIDALCQITGTTESYSSLVPEPFTFIPEHHSSIALEDGSISSSFLEMFGRPPRDTGLLSERTLRPSPAQRLHLLNSSHVARKIEQSAKLRNLIQSSRNPAEVMNRLYLTILSRFPTEEELRIAREYRRSAAVNEREAVVDLAWALINGAEFLHRH